MRKLLLIPALWSTLQLPLQGATVVVDVQADTAAPKYEAGRALDGNPDTLWHTAWGANAAPLPHEILIDLGADYSVTGFVYTPRKGEGNGTIADYECHVCTDPAHRGAAVRSGQFKYDCVPTPVQTVEFPATRGRYFILRALSEVNGKNYASVAELEIQTLEKTVFRSAAPAQTKEAAEAPPIVLKPDEMMPADLGTTESVLALTRNTLAFVQQTALRPKLAEEFQALEKKIAASGDQEKYLDELRGLRRRIIFSHPLLAFDDLLINKRLVPAFSHQSDQYLGRHSGAGDGLVVLGNWKEKLTEKVLLKGGLPPGSVLHPDLSYDAEKILFSYCDHTEERTDYRRYFLYEINRDGSGLRQLTGTAADPLEGFEGRQSALIEDFDPCYLPDGSIAFISTRNQGGVRCHHGDRYCMTYTMYGCDGDGGNIHPIVYGEANEWDPSVMNDGKIIWCRWDYINRHDTIYQGLWTTKPDGTATAHYYGSYTRNPCLTSEAKAVPGSRLVCATAGAHHAYIAGSIILLDPAKGQDGDAPIRRITPEARFPETEGWHEKAYCTPYPLSENLFLAAYTTGKIRKQGNDPTADAYAIYLVDTLGGRELIYRDPHISCFAPIPLQPRKRPPVLPPILPDAPAGTPGTFYVQNVYESTENIPRGSVKRLRIVQIYPQPAQRAPDRSLVLFELPKKIIGTVPVDANGSTAFEAPSGVPLLFQLLDENNMCVMSMRSFVYAHPGESASCVGCHEPRQSAPAYGTALSTRVHQPVPPAGPQYEGGLSFAKTVQPVFDRHCISCHGLDQKPNGGINLLGTMDDGALKLGQVKASTAYHSLASNRRLVSMALRNEEAERSTPKDYFAYAGELGPMLLNGDKNHKKLDAESFERIIDWLDLNGQFYGSYSWNKDEWRTTNPSAEQELRNIVAETFGKELAAQPFAALVNIALPEESRILKAPLAEAAGGWGQISNGWNSTADEGYLKMFQAVEKSIQPLETCDVAGTCNQDPCECKSCWVRAAEAEYRKKTSHGPAFGEVGLALRARHKHGKLGR